MSSLIKSLDTCTPMQIGEKGHTELGWSNDIQESIVQLFFQIVRSATKTTVSIIKNKFQNILKQINQIYSSNTINEEQYKMYMSIMGKLTAQSRDIIAGKGEYEISYALLSAWEQENMFRISKYLFKHFLMSPVENPEEHPFGSWKDVKYFYLRYPESSLVEASIDWVCEQLRTDSISLTPSLLAKWIPRQQNKKYDALYTRLASHYYAHYLETAKTDEQRRKAILKAKTHFRQLISPINKKLDTVQIKQCAQNWTDIDPAKQTSITMHLQKKAFLNKKKDGSQRSGDQDRIECALHFTEFTQQAKEGKVKINGKRLGLNSFTENAIKLLSSSSRNNTEKDILNAQWVDNRTQSKKLGKFIAMVDVSGSMDGDPLHAAIALGIRVGEMSELGKRVLTFSERPKWVNLDGIDDFTEMVSKLKASEWGMTTNFYAAMNMILDIIVQKKLPPEEVEDMVLAIFSDMQINQADSKMNSDVLQKQIDIMYHQAGLRTFGVPYKAPHILFWNLRSTTGFPTLSTTSNVSMMSGFSPVLLNNFCELGLDALQNMTPWNLLQQSLNIPRYHHIETFVNNFL